VYFALEHFFERFPALFIFVYERRFAHLCVNAKIAIRMLGGVNIDTAQNVTINYELANLGDRLLAYLIDFVILFSYSFFLGRVVFYQSEPHLLLVIISMLPLVFYFFLCELFFNGQSVGKKVMKIKVLKLDGSSASFFDYLLRWMLWPLDNFYGLGLLVLLINGRGQRIGDLAAGTSVVKVKLQASLSDTVYMPLEPAYRPTFPEVMRLSDANIRLVFDVLRHQSKGRRSENLVSVAAQKVKAITNVNTELSDLDLLRTVMKDYNYYAQKVK
jgi:uncharacterized RDD family membrane protein YckC